MRRGSKRVVKRRKGEMSKNEKKKEEMKKGRYTEGRIQKGREEKRGIYVQTIDTKKEIYLSVFFMTRRDI